MFSTRTGIYYNVQRMCEVHEQFLAHLQNITTPKVAATDTELSNLISGGPLKHSKSLHNKALGSQKLKQSYNNRVKLVSADPDEARDVARAMGTLVSSHRPSRVCACLSLPALYSRPHLKCMRHSAAITNYFVRI